MAGIFTGRQSLRVRQLPVRPLCVPRAVARVIGDCAHGHAVGTGDGEFDGQWGLPKNELRVYRILDIGTGGG